MSIFFDSYASRGLSDGVTLQSDVGVQFGGEDVGFGEAFIQGYKTQRDSRNVDSFVTLLTNEMQPIIDMIEERTGETFVNPGSYFGMSAQKGHNERRRNNSLNGILQHIQDNADVYPELSDFTLESLKSSIEAKALASMEKGADASARQTLSGDIGEFIGATTGALGDDAFLEIMMIAPIGFLGNISKNLAQVSIREAFIGASYETVLQPGVMEWYEQLGLEYTKEDYLKAIAFGGVIGGALPATFTGIGQGVRMTTQQMRKTIQGLKSDGAMPAREADLLDDALDDLEELENAPPEVLESNQVEEPSPAIVDKNSVDKPDLEPEPIDLNQLRDRLDDQAVQDDTFSLTPEQTSSATTNELKLVDDLKNQADEATILDNPAFAEAEKKITEIPITSEAPNYGSIEWDLNRTFNFEGEPPVTGYLSGVNKLYEKAKRLGWVDEKLDVPDSPVAYNKKAIIIIGPPASGKSSIANPLARKHKAAIIDSDEAKKVLPEYKGGDGANAVHKESQEISKIMEMKGMDEGLNMVFPTVGSDPSKIRKMIDRLKRNGYEVDLVGMDVSFVQARARMIMRWITTGRYIAYDYVKKVGDKPKETYYTIKKEGLADGYTLIDNNGPRNAPKPLIEDTRGLTEGTDLRLRQDRPGSGGLGGQSTGSSPDAADTQGLTDFTDHVVAAREATIDVAMGKVPDNAALATDVRPDRVDDPLTDVEISRLIDQVAEDTGFERMADDEQFFIDDIDGDPKARTGAEIKEELAQEQAMLDRLRGCVI